MTLDLRVIDLFSGAGGFGQAFKRKFNVELAVDFWDDAIETYRLNHPNTQTKNEDIRNINFSTKDFDMITAITGGPPCQDFSNLNYRRDTDSKRANLMFEMLRAIEEIKPDMFIIENVATIPKKYKKSVVKRLKKLDYKITHKIVNGYDYGSIQKRPRWILTGSKFRHVYPEPNPINRQAKEILEPDIVSEMGVTDRVKSQFKHLKKGEWDSLPGQNYKAYFVVDPSDLLPAIVNPTKSRFVKPDKSGYLSKLEINRAQGFPDDYEFAGNLSSWGQQVANAIPVEVADSFSNAFYEAIIKDRSSLSYYF